MKPRLIAPALIRPFFATCLNARRRSSRCFAAATSTGARRCKRGRRFCRWMARCGARAASSPLALGLFDLAGAFRSKGDPRIVRPADRSLQRALAFALEERTGGKGRRRLCCDRARQLGGRELNYSSDVDLVCLRSDTLAGGRARSGGAAVGWRNAWSTCSRNGPKTAMPFG